MTETFTDDNRFVAHVTNQLSTSTGNAGELKYAHLYQENLKIIQAQVNLFKIVQSFSPKPSCTILVFFRKLIINKKFAISNKFTRY